MKLEVGGIKEPVRLDVFLAGRLGLSRNYIQKLIEEGNVSLGKAKKIKKDLRLRNGDTIEIVLPPPGNAVAQPEDIPLDIIYEDTDVLVLNKKAGMVVHPTSKVFTGTLINALLFHLGSTFVVGSPQRPGIVHRLDRDTSGIMVVAKTSLAYTSLVKQFSNREVYKKYLALVSGDVKQEGEIETFFGRHPMLRQKMSVWGGLYGRRGTSARKAITVIKILERFGHCTLLEVFPRTGRTHQIRVHLSYLGHPVVGDKTYGGNSVLMVNERKFSVKRQMLHAWSIGFTHPATGRYLEFTAPVPEDMQEILEELGYGALRR